MDWIQDNIVTLGAIIGALYTAARLIVFLTPTPKDDAVLGKLQKLVALIAGVAGLDKRQGLKG